MLGQNFKNLYPTGLTTGNKLRIWYQDSYQHMLHKPFLVWSPHIVKDVNLLETVQKCATRWELHNYFFLVPFPWHMLYVALTYIVCYLWLFIIWDIYHNSSKPFLNYFTCNTIPTLSYTLFLVPPPSTIEDILCVCLLHLEQTSYWFV